MRPSQVLLMVAVAVRLLIGVFLTGIAAPRSRGLRDRPFLAMLPNALWASCRAVVLPAAMTFRTGMALWAIAGTTTGPPTAAAG